MDYILKGIIFKDKINSPLGEITMDRYSQRGPPGRGSS